MTLYRIKTLFSDLFFILAVLYSIYKAITIINKRNYEKYVSQAKRAQDRELRTYEKIEKMSEKLSTEIKASRQK